MTHEQINLLQVQSNESDSELEQEEDDKETRIPNEEYYAFNSKGKWDNVPILDTENWPDICRFGQKQSPIWIDLKNLGTKDL